MSGINAIIQLSKAITAAGGKNPKAVSDLIATWDAACTAADDLGDTDMTAALADGALTAKTAATVIPDAARRVAAHAAAVELVHELEPKIAHAATLAYRGQAGEELIESLRPAFDKAASAIAATPFSPDDARNPSKILALGDEAAQAWRDLPRHAAVLDAMYRNVLYKLVLDVDVLPDHGWGKPEARFVPFIIDADHKADVIGAAQVIVSSYGTGEPGGPWHRLVRAGYKLRLNTPSEAAALADQHNAAIVTDSQRQAKRESEATAHIREQLSGRNNRRALADTR
jgi:hypothetical protein